MPEEPIEVTVLDGDTGDPIEGATVTSTCFFTTGEDGDQTVGDEGEIRETNEDGVAYLALPPQGADGGYNSCDFEVMAEGYETSHHRLDLDNLEDQTVELTPTEDGDGDGETHTATVVVTDLDGVRLEGLDVSVTTYEAGEPIGEGTTDECGEVQFEVEDGGYEVRAYSDELSQSSANMGFGVDGEDVAYIINLYDTDEYDGEAPETGRNITEPEPCEGAEVNPGDGDNTGDGNGDDDVDEPGDGEGDSDGDGDDGDDGEGDDTDDGEGDGDDSKSSTDDTSGESATESESRDPDCPTK